jgi:RNA-binding protein
MNDLSNNQIRHLKSLAHDLKPVVIIGDKGLTKSVIDEIINSIDIHELIKVKIRADDKEERLKMIETIAKKTQSSKVQLVGHIVTLFKRNKDPQIAIPKK